MYRTPTQTRPSAEDRLFAVILVCVALGMVLPAAGLATGAHGGGTAATVSSQQAFSGSPILPRMPARRA